jgi:sensory rhodopsin
MSTHVTFTYALAVVAFAVGVGIVYRLVNNPDVDSEYGAFKYLAIIPGFAGLSYVAMTFDIGLLTVGSNTINLPRYIDWLITTPLLVGYVGYVAGAPQKWIAGSMVADALMIVAGAGATLTTGTPKWALFAISGGFHLSLLYVLYGVFPKYASEHTKRLGLFELLQNHVGLLWLAYPLVWIIGASGLGFVTAAGISLIIAYLDVVAKVPYVYFIWNRRHSFDRDAAMGETGTAGQSGQGAVADD